MAGSGLLRNGQSVPVADVPVVSPDAFEGAIAGALDGNWRALALLGRPAPAGFRLHAVLGSERTADLAIVATDLKGDRYPSMADRYPQLQGFERDLAASLGLKVDGEFHAQAHGEGPSSGAAAGAQGEHEVGVGPIHAGIIEPGHFRFRCQGERIVELDIALGYQHRGVERALVGGPDRRTIALVETIAGDTTIGHALAHAQLVEGLCGREVPARALAMRALALELERLANHVGDLGALAGDVGYLPTASFCGRLRGEFLNATAMVCGSRFGRGWMRPGGGRDDLDADQRELLARRLRSAGGDLEASVDLLFSSPSVLARFGPAGRLSRSRCLELGLVGPVARACGIERDVRRDFPLGLFAMAQIPVSTWHSGGVFARAYVRWLEARRSLDFLADLLAWLPEGPSAGTDSPLATGGCRLAVSLVEGWRGEICHVAETDASGRFVAYKIVDPSLHNWAGLSVAMRDQAISDFPLCNKSFNLSYCGHDR